MKEEEIRERLKLLMWALTRTPPLHPSDGQNCTIGLEIRILCEVLGEDPDKLYAEFKKSDYWPPHIPHPHEVMRKGFWPKEKEL